LLQNNGNGIIRITCPAIETDRMNIQPISLWQKITVGINFA
jgi:hypothetical protein